MKVKCFIFTGKLTASMKSAYINVKGKQKKLKSKIDFDKWVIDRWGSLVIYSLPNKNIM